MPTQTSFGLDFEAQDQPATESAAETAAIPDKPLITGDETSLWVGFGAVMAVFLILLVSVIRARVIKPAERIARATDFFEPAGADADITFDDPAQLQIQEIKKARKKKRAEKAAARHGLDQDEPVEVEPDGEISNLEESQAQSDADDVEPAEGGAIASEETLKIDEPGAEPDQQLAEIAAAIDDAATTDAVEPESPKPLTSLFDRDAAEPETPAPDDGGDDMLALTEAPGDVRIGHLPEVDEDYWDAERQRQEAEAAYKHAEEERRLALEEAARARADAEAAHRRLETEREASARAAESERRTTEAIDKERLQAMSQMQGKLDAMADRMARNADTTEARLSAAIEEKFTGLGEALQGRLNAFAADIEKTQQLAEASVRREDSETGLAEIALHLDALQKTTASALASLAERIDELSAQRSSEVAAPEALQQLNAALAQRAAPAVAGTLQLNDLVRSTLPAGRYAFDHQLSNAANADCLVKRAGGDIAIDASFPVEAFDRYARADDASREHAATAYRRAVLRHMIFVAEKLIAPAETADFAILFAPSDTIFTDLHQNFADLVQDSYRARIWIASPTSLMAMLHMMNAVVQTEDERQASAAASEETIAALADRFSALEKDIIELQTRPAAAAVPVEPASTTPTSSEDEDATMIPETDEAEVRIISDGATPADDKPAEDDSDSARTPFPLR